jgi:hypothetical protein
MCGGVKGASPSVRQARFRHLFGEPGHPEVVERLQRQADRTIARYGLLAEEAQ